MKIDPGNVPGAQLLKYAQILMTSVAPPTLASAKTAQSSEDAAGGHSLPPWRVLRASTYYQSDSKTHVNLFTQTPQNRFFVVNQVNCSEINRSSSP